ncbi:MAG: response regulator [Acidobacteriota bacterium]|nr:response regulator [Acidobacteriota bacterium]
MATQSAPRLVRKPFAVPPPRRQTILCIDDSAAILAMLATVLGGAGYAVVSCGDANSALEHFMGGEIDLVVLDYDMPTANGVELARLFRRIDPTVPLLMFSGSVLADSEGALLDGFVPKGAAGCDSLLKAVQAGLAAPAE